MWGQQAQHHTPLPPPPTPTPSTYNMLCHHWAATDTGARQQHARVRPRLHSPWRVPAVVGRGWKLTSEPTIIPWIPVVSTPIPSASVGAAQVRGAYGMAPAPWPACHTDTSTAQGAASAVAMWGAATADHATTNGQVGAFGALSLSPHITGWRCVGQGHTGRVKPDTCSLHHPSETCGSHGSGRRAAVVASRRWWGSRTRRCTRPRQIRMPPRPASARCPRHRTYGTHHMR